MKKLLSALLPLVFCLPAFAADNMAIDNISITERCLYKLAESYTCCADANPEDYAHLQYLLEHGAGKLINKGRDSRIWAYSPPNNAHNAFTVITAIEPPEMHGDIGQRALKTAKLLIKYCEDPTAKIANMTFWLDATPEEVRKAVKKADLSTVTTVREECDGRDTMTVLDFALLYGTDETARIALDAYTKPLDYTSMNGITPLMRAAMGERGLPIIKRIVERAGTVDVRITDRDGFNGGTALHYADWSDNDRYMDVRRYLLSLTTNPTDRFLSYTYWLTATPEQFQKDLKDGGNVNACVTSGEEFHVPLYYAEKATSNKALLEALKTAGAKPFTLEGEKWHCQID